jgi:tetratricopeptide (TPR) repeat protein
VALSSTGAGRRGARDRATKEERLSGIKQAKRDLDTAVAALEALDAALAEGRLTADDHARQRAERERAVGRRFLALRDARRAARDEAADGQGALDARRSARDDLADERAGRRRRDAETPRNTAVIVTAAVLLLAAGIGGGVAVGRWFTATPRAGAPAETAATSGAGPSNAMSEIELQALRQAAAREDAPIPSLLQFAHAALDQDRLGEARQVYERVLSREPRNVEAITHIGGVHFKEGRLDEALAKVEEALRIDPRYVHALWDRVQYLHHGKRDFPGAVKAAEAFLRVVPDGPDAESIRTLAAEARQEASKSGQPVSRPR